MLYATVDSSPQEQMSGNFFEALTTCEPTSTPDLSAVCDPCSFLHDDGCTSVPTRSDLRCVARVAPLAPYACIDEQLEFHRETRSASTSPIEKCRRQFHIAAIVLATLSICYFAMVLGNAIWWSVMLWTVMQMPTYIAGAALAVRMWIYT